MLNTRYINESENCCNGYEERLWKRPPSITSIRMRLQFFAESSGGDKTEKATPKKREDARKKGQVLQSKDISNAVVLTAIFLAIKVMGRYLYGEISSFFVYVFENYPALLEDTSINSISVIYKDVLFLFLKVAGPLLAIGLVLGVIVSAMQVGSVFTLETLKPQFNKINPLNGFKRIFSIKSVAELFKSLAKVAVIGYIAYTGIVAELYNFAKLMHMDVMSIAAYIGDTSINVALRICIALIILGVIDYAYQWWQYEKDLKMTKHEVKEEYKQTEGNPEIKQKIKQKQREISMRRMMNDIPQADVVITNPTHFAVAIKYDIKVAPAPVVIAKGQDFIALRIKEIAKENKVEVVENKPLARTLFSTVEIGESIPPDLFQAVAEILAFVYSLKGRTG